MKHLNYTNRYPIPPGLLSGICFGDVDSPGFGQQYIVPEFVCVCGVKMVVGNGVEWSEVPAS